MKSFSVYENMFSQPNRSMPNRQLIFPFTWFALRRDSWTNKATMNSQPKVVLFIRIITRKFAQIEFY